MKYLLDTNIIIDCLRAHRPSVQLVDKLFSDPNTEIYLSAITNLELHLGSSIVRPRIQEMINNILSQCYVVDITLEIAGKAGDLKRENKTEIPDALIAASCLLNNLTLLTRNIKHFRNIPELKIKPAI